MTKSIQGPSLLVSDPITQAHTNTVVNAIEIPAGSFIPPYGVTVNVIEALAGGTPSLDVGDGDAADGWIDTTEITEGTEGCYSGVAAAFAVAGKYYPSGGQIKVTVATGLTDGTAYVTAMIYNLADLGLAAA